MADKEFLLGNRARELLKYTKQATRVVSGDISKADVRAIITRVAELDDICDVKMVCQEVVHVLDTKDKEASQRVPSECMERICAKPRKRS